MTLLQIDAPRPDTSFEGIACGLERDGFAVVPAGLPENVAAALSSRIARLGDDDFHAAAIGRGQDQHENRFVRRDDIHWLEEDAPGIEPWHEWTEELRTYLNRRLFLGLFSFESHLAVYDEGGFYKTHFDAFKGEANRIVSLVTYLNEGWNSIDGGELVIYTPDGAVNVTPHYRTLVLFLSEDFAHEVRPCRRRRYSAAGWFRLNTSILDRIDPPR